MIFENKNLSHAAEFANFCNWTDKNIPDIQQCVKFRKLQKVLNHSILVYLYTMQYSTVVCCGYNITLSILSYGQV